jgi:type VI secretion system secreted protein Hcp
MEVGLVEITIRRSSRWLLASAVVGAVVLGLVFTRPAGSAIPAGSVVGRVTYTDINGSTDLTATIRTFTMSASATVSGGGGGGGGTGKATFSTPRVVQEVVSGSPWIMSALASGKHLPTVVVTLYRANSSKRSQTWVYTSAFITLDDQTQKGPATKTPSETVGWSFDSVRQTTYKSDGTTISTTSCFDVAQNKAC